MKKRMLLVLLALSLASPLCAGVFSSYDFTFYRTMEKSMTVLNRSEVGLDVTGYGFLGESNKGVYLRMGLQTPFDTILSLLYRAVTEGLAAANSKQVGLEKTPSDASGETMEAMEELAGTDIIGSIQSAVGGLQLPGPSSIFGEKEQNFPSNDNGSQTEPTLPSDEIPPTISLPTDFNGNGNSGFGSSDIVGIPGTGSIPETIGPIGGTGPVDIPSIGTPSDGSLSIGTIPDLGGPTDIGGSVPDIGNLGPIGGTPEQGNQNETVVPETPTTENQGALDIDGGLSVDTSKSGDNAEDGDTEFNAFDRIKTEWSASFTIGPAKRSMMGENAMVYLGTGLSTYMGYSSELLDSDDSMQEYSLILGTDIDAGFRIDVKTHTTIRIGVHFTADLLGLQGYSIVSPEGEPVESRSYAYGYLLSAEYYSGVGYMRLATTFRKKTKRIVNYTNKTPYIGKGTVEIIEI